MLELLGCGFNAHSQLFHDGDFPDDVATPLKSLAKGDSVRLLFSGWSDLLLERNGEVFWHGTQAPPDGKADVPADAEVVGNHAGPWGAIAGEGVFCCRNAQFVHTELQLSHVAVAGNGRVCTVADGTRVLSHAAAAAGPTSLLALPRHERSWHIPTDGVLQLVANETSFTLLTAEGEVFTWGDARHGAVLGRETTGDEPATEPAIVGALEGMRMAKVASGGWISAALSEDRDVYIWGQTGPGGGEKQVLEFLPDTVGEAGLVDLGEGVDAVDVAVGDGHVLVLTAGGDVFAAGRGESGQTGVLGAGYTGEWRKLERSWEGRAVGVFSGMGSLNSFVLVERDG